MTFLIFHSKVSRKYPVKVSPLKRISTLSDNSNCRLLINELNSGSPGNLGKNNFLEFTSYCGGDRTSIPLQGFKVIGISTGTTHANQITIDLVINMWNMKTNENGMLTIGGPNVPNVDVRIPNAYVRFRNEFQKNQKTLFSFLSTANKNLHAIAILYSEKNPIPEITLSAKQPFIKIDNDLKELIKSNLMDMVVYGRRAPFDNCELFLDLYPKFTNRKYVLREIDDENQNIDYTLNRCAIETCGFIPEKFKLGKPTPAAENDCSGIHFILEEHLLDVTSPLQDVGNPNEESEDVSMDQNTAQCSSSQATSQYSSAKISVINEEIARRMSEDQNDDCVALDLSADGADIAVELNVENQRKRKISDTADYSEEFEWETKKYFQ